MLIAKQLGETKWQDGLARGAPLADGQPYPPGCFEGKTGRVRTGNCRDADTTIDLEAFQRNYLPRQQPSKRFLW